MPAASYAAAYAASHRARSPLAWSGSPPLAREERIAAWVPRRGYGDALVPGPKRPCCCHWPSRRSRSGYMAN